MTNCNYNALRGFPFGLLSQATRPFFLGKRDVEVGPRWFWSALSVQMYEHRLQMYTDECLKGRCHLLSAFCPTPMTPLGVVNYNHRVRERDGWKDKRVAINDWIRMINDEVMAAGLNGCWIIDGRTDG